MGFRVSGFGFRQVLLIISLATQMRQGLSEVKDGQPREGGRSKLGIRAT